MESVDRAGEPSGHAHPLKAPEGFRPCTGISDLYYRWQAAWGGSMLSGTETIAVALFNGGYSLEEVVVKVTGLGADGSDVFAVRRDVESLPRGEEVTIELPSYELPAPARDLSVALVAGRMRSES